MGIGVRALFPWICERRKKLSCTDSLPGPGVIRNPILSGFYPDPSVCRVGADFYLVNSTFSWYPGIPVSHSRDLISWRHIGNVIERTSQLEFADQGISRGLFAPAIRHDGNRFYVTCTDIDGIGNFVVTAENPAGPWSDPVSLDAPGIDPSLFFDDSTGRAWYVGTRPAPEGEAYSGNWEVWIREFDPVALCLVGPTRGIWRGALRDCIWPEGPHLYLIDGRYYLTIAEGGTGPDHAVTVARSDSLEGPWIGKPSNPILTHRHLGSRADIVNVGHGDLFDDGAGGWWMVFLASRPFGAERCSNLGRETFIAPVTWENGWPLVTAETGRVELSYPAPNLNPPAPRVPPLPACEHFDAPKLNRQWLTLRHSAKSFSSLTERPGHLRLFAQCGTISDKAPVAFAGLRQTSFDWALSCSMELSRTDRTNPRDEPASIIDSALSAGIALVQSESNHFRFELMPGAERLALRVVRFAKEHTPAAGEVLAETVIHSFADVDAPRASYSPENPASASILLSVLQRGQRLSFFWKHPNEMEDSWHPVVIDVDASILSTEKAGGFVGTVLGLYASGNGKANAGHADFDWMEYRPLN